MSKENCERKPHQKVPYHWSLARRNLFYIWKSGWSPKGIKSSDKSIEKARPHVIITTMEDPEVLDECNSGAIGCSCNIS